MTVLLIAALSWCALGVASPLAFASPGAAAQAAYVSSTGSDANSCASEAQACASLTRALSVVAAGGVVYVSGTIGLTSTEQADGINISRDVTIEQDPAAGASAAAIDGEDGGDGIFFVSGSLTVAFDGLTIENGRIIGSGSDGGAGGAIYNNGGTITVSNSTFTSNYAIGASEASGSGGGSGGAIYSQGGALIVSGSTFASNYATGGSGSSGNSGGTGGAIYSQGGTLAVAVSTFRSNYATGGSGSGTNDGGDGGAIDNADSGSGTATISESTFASDYATGGSGGAPNYGGDGGAIDNADSGTGIATISETTFASDYATGGSGQGPNYGGDGGAIDNADYGGSGTASVSDSTFASDYATGGSGTATNYGGDGAAIDNADGNGTGSVHVGGDLFADACAGSGFADGGFNAGTGTTCLGGSPLATDTVAAVVGSDLGSLAANGGPTLTFALAAGNPAIGLIAAGTSTALVSCPLTDQRGDVSPAGASCDAGAVQYAAQTVSFTSTASNPTMGGSYAPTATSTSGLAVSLTVDSTTTNGACAISAGIVSFVHAGTCVIDANQAGNTYYAPGQAQLRITVPKTAQTISFTSIPPSNAMVDQTYTPSATGGGSGQQVTFTLAPTTTNDACSISAGAVSFANPGECVIEANEAGNTDYLAASEVQQTITVLPVSQTISFTSVAPAAIPIGGTYVPTATSTSGLAVSLTIDSTSTNNACSISAGVVSFAHVGECVIDANQSGTPYYVAAGQVQQSVTVTQASQTVSFTSSPPSSVTVGESYVPTASGGGSGQAVTFSVASTTTNSACSISSGIVSFTNPGECVIDANQNGNSDYLAAGQAQQTISVTQVPQTVGFTSSAPADAAVGQSYAPTATSTSGLAVSLTVDPTTTNNACAITAGTVSFVHAGTCVIDANQSGNSDYLAADQTQQSITVTPATPTISGHQSGHSLTITITLPSGLTAKRFSLAWQSGVSFGPKVTPGSIRRQLAVHLVPSGKPVAFTITKLSGSHGSVSITTGAALSDLTVKVNVADLRLSATELASLKRHHTKQLTGTLEITTTSGTVYTQRVTATT